MTQGDSLPEFQLPSLPRAVFRILQLLKDPDVKLSGLASEIEYDPALAAKVVRLANSSLYGQTQSVTNVQRAAVVLGLRALKHTVLGFSLASIFDPRAASFRLHDSWRFAAIWRRILTNAIGCRIAASAFSIDPEDAFLAGLMQDIMVLGFGVSLGEKYFSVYDKKDDDGAELLVRLEFGALGTTHAEQGGRLLLKWQFPQELSDAVAHHHDADVGLADPIGAKVELAHLMALVERVTEFLLHPTIERLESYQAFAQRLRRSGFERDAFLLQLGKQVSELADIFDLVLPTGDSYADIVAKADAMANEPTPEGEG